MKSNQTNSPSDSQLIITRIFDAPREKVWQAWTSPEIVKKWWGPKEFTAPEIRIDFREAGRYLFCMEGKAVTGEPIQRFCSTGVFREIMPMEKIVFTDSFADEKGHQVPATFYGMSEDFPLEMTVILTFEKIDGKTKFTLNYPDRGNIGDLDREGMKEGWNQSLDKLAEVLKN